MKRKINKQNFVLLLICILIVALVVIIVIGMKNNRKQQATTITSTTTSISQESTTGLFNDAETVSKKNGLFYIVDPDKDSALKDEDVWSYDNTIEKAIIPSISKKPNFYYFEQDHFSKNANGLYPYGDDYYYMKNGVCDQKFTGFVSYQNYMRYVRNGKWDRSFNGKFYVDKDDDNPSIIENGSLHGFEMGREDGFVLPSSFKGWYVKAN